VSKLLCALLAIVALYIAQATLAPNQVSGLCCKKR
jgi:hypothetical protein